MHSSALVFHRLALAPATCRQMLLAGAAALCLGLFAGPADARSKTAGTSAESERPSKKNAVKVKHQRSPSEESKAERDRRLYRECQGRPNAGACLGYTRKP